MKYDARSESDLIRLLRAAPQDYPSSLLQQIGDDCAIFDPSFADRLVVTTDLLLESIHFRRDWISARLLGRKSLLVNLSDVVAMGARPYACLLGLGIPQDLTGDYFEHFLAGFLQECQRVRMPLIGGDLSKSSKIVVSVTAWGFLGSSKPILRSGGQASDHILLIGKTGCSRLGLEYLEQRRGVGVSRISDEAELREWIGDSDSYQWMKAHFLPEIYAREAAWIAERGLAHSMIDVSDGLGQDLLHILEESRLSGELKLEEVPIPPGMEDVERARDYALNGGEDYALLFTASDEQLKDLRRDYPEDFTPFIEIGHLHSGPAKLYLQSEDGRRVQYHSKGFQHFP